MIIELCGLPGSGKTSLMKNLIATAPEIFMEAKLKSKLNRYYFVLSYFFLQPAKIFFWLKLLLNNSTLWKYKLHLLAVSCARRQAAEVLSKTGAGVVALVDEGFLQRLFTIMDRRLTAGEFVSILAKLDLPDAVILMSGGDFGRFFSKPGGVNSPRYIRGPEYLKQWADNFKDNFASFIKAMERFPKVKIINASGSGLGSLNAAADLVKSEINNL